MILVGVLLAVPAIRPTQIGTVQSLSLGLAILAAAMFGPGSRR